MGIWGRIVGRASTLIALSSTLGCTSYVVLQARPENDDGGSSTYTCPAAAEGAEGVLTGDCTLDTTVDESRWNQSGTTTYLLPDCPYGVRRIRVGGGAALVECEAPSENTSDIHVPTSGGSTMPPPATGPDTTGPTSVGGE